MVYPPSGLNDLCKGDDHPAYAPSGAWPSFTFIVFGRPSLSATLFVSNITGNGEQQ